MTLVRMICLTIVLVSNPAIAEPAAGSQSDPADRLVARLAGIESLQARFEQSGANHRQGGHFWVNKPDQFRVESEPPLSQTIVTDGVSLWTYDRDLEQVIISDLASVAASIPLLLFAGDPLAIQNRYRIDFFEDELHEYFVLEPLAAEGAVKGIAIAFRDGLPVRLSFENAMREKTVINFMNIDLTAPAPETFTFVSPEFVDVIDDRPVTDVTL